MSDMAFRFLYVDADGQEVQVASLDDFRALVRDGVIVEDTLLYDALSRDWATARFHPVYRLAIEDISRSWSEDTDGSESGLPNSASDLGLLQTDSEAPDATTAFLEEYERERRRAELESGVSRPAIPGLDRQSNRPGLDVEPTDDGVPEVPADSADDETSDAPSRRRDVPSSTTGSRDGHVFDGERRDFTGDRRGSPEDSPGSAEVGGVPDPHPRDSRRARDESRSRVASAPSRKSGPARPPRVPENFPRVMVHPGWSSEPIRQVVLFAAVVAIGGWGIAEAWATDPIPPVDEEVLVHEARVASDAYTAPGALLIRESADAAFSDMTAGMQRIQAQLGVGAPPQSWLSGEYLSDPESAPEVMEYWDRYDALVDSLRAAEADLFRAGFVTRLQRQGITGSVLSIRLARAMQDFTADAPRREVVYSAMDDMVEEARSLDTFLHENSGRIAFAGVRSGALSSDPATEAVPLDDQTRQRLAEHLDRLFLAMDEVTGTDPTRRRDLTGNVMKLLRGGG